MDPMAVMLLGLLLFVLPATVVALVVVLLVRAVGAARTRVHATAESARLRARAFALGPAAEVARLRLELRAAIDAVGQALAGALAARWPVGDTPMLVRRLEAAAAGVDAQLRVLELERDPRRLAGALPRLRERASTVAGSAAALRLALLESGLRTGEDELASLRADCAIEADALRARPRRPASLT